MYDADPHGDILIQDDNPAPVLCELCGSSNTEYDPESEGHGCMACGYVSVGSL